MSGFKSRGLTKSLRSSCLRRISSGVSPGKGFRPVKELVGGDTVGEEVGPVINGLAQELFGRHISGGAWVLRTASAVWEG